MMEQAISAADANRSVSCLLREVRDGRKARRPTPEVREAVLGWHDAYLIADTSSGVLLDTMELATSHQFALSDAIMLAAAARSGCRWLLFEPMQDGFTWRGVAVRNPFADVPVSAR